VEELERKKSAENERLKGNECMKSKDYELALACYSKSIDLDEKEYTTYANRALARIKLKDFT
jgi:tetratricopeptide (TPR) repeat protein